jgi:hypothetical protein
MAMRLPRLLLPLLAAIAASAGSVAAQDNDITIYRCTDAGGHLTVQDSPCAADQSQQVRRMIQPTDPPPRAEPVAPAALKTAPEPWAPMVARHEPRAMYECVRDDGSRYTSGDGEGNPRWVSGGGWSYRDGPFLRGTGVGSSRGQAASSGPALLASTRATGAGSGNQPRPRFRSTDSTPPPPPPGPGHGHGHGHHGGHGLGGYGGGMWVRDECHALPQVEVCDRLRDRREQIRRRAFNAQANERATLGTEERGINARLAEDCGGA